jgi:hypothetical protein
MQRIVSVALAIVALACAGPSEPRETDPTERTSAAPYEVHEWGLVRSEAGDVLRVGAIAPPGQPELLVADKPILYFHAASPLTIDSVVVRAPGGAILEHWPTAADVESSSVTWRDVRLDAEACEPSPLPRLTDPPCSSLPAGSMCESAELGVTRTPDASCVRHGQATERFLFYRSEARTFTPPLRFARRGTAGEVEVTNDGALPIPGVLLRIWSDGRSTRTLAVPAPAPGQSLVVARPGGADDTRDEPARPMDEADAPFLIEGPAGDAIRQTMRELGMTEPEIDAFLRAWTPALFRGAVAMDRLRADGELAPTESFLYFVPERAADAIATLAFDPPPIAVRRAIAVWTTVRASGSSR